MTGKREHPEPHHEPVKALSIDRHRRATSLISSRPGHHVSRAVHVRMRVHTGVTITDDTIHDDGGGPRPACSP